MHDFLIDDSDAEEAKACYACRLSTSDKELYIQNEIQAFGVRPATGSSSGVTKRVVEDVVEAVNMTREGMDFVLNRSKAAPVTQLALREGDLW